jgi:hypothetical protein
MEAFATARQKFREIFSRQRVSLLSPNGQKTHEVMFNTSDHKGNVNQNHIKISPHSCSNGYDQEHKQQQMLARMWG